MMKPILFNTDMVRAILDGRKTVTRQVVNHKHLRGLENLSAEKIQRACVVPYRPGDILYVRETWAKCQNAESYVYKADFDGYAADVFLPLMKWRPSIHMPREAARIWLRVTDVRVERLQEVTDREAEKEGIGDLFYEEIGFGNKDYGCVTYSDSKGVIGFQKEQFAHLWDSTIKPKDRDKYGWAANPWVWVIAFERCSKPEEVHRCWNLQ